MDIWLPVYFDGELDFTKKQIFFGGVIMKNFRFWSVIILVFSFAACVQKTGQAPAGKSLSGEAPSPVAAPAPVEAAPPPPAPVVVETAPVLAEKTVPAKPAPVITRHAKPKAGPKLKVGGAAVAGKDGTAELMAANGAPAGSGNAAGFKKIKAELAADPVITTPGNPGDLRVWIGDPDLKANFPGGMTTASAVIATSSKPSTVLVTPNAPAFNVSPESTCSKFDPAGTTVHFKLVPKLEQAGKYRVGAGVWLYDSIDCTGTPNPKDAPDLQVQVVVKVIPYDMLKSLREAISKFWVELLGLVVAFLLFLARNFLKKAFGFEDKSS